MALVFLLGLFNAKVIVHCSLLMVVFVPNACVKLLLMVVCVSAGSWDGKGGREGGDAVGIRLSERHAEFFNAQYRRDGKRRPRVVRPRCVCGSRSVVCKVRHAGLLCVKNRLRLTVQH